MLTLAPPNSATAFTALLLGSGELGKEVAIELMRYGVRVVAADRYENAPAQLVANEARVLNMNSAKELRALIEKVKPDVIVPEIEAIATEVLVEVEQSGARSRAGNQTRIVPSSKAVHLTMNREGIRRLAAEELAIPTSRYQFAQSLAEVKTAGETLGFPVVVKPVQSSSGKGQSVARSASELEDSWWIAQDGARGGGEGVQKVIVEAFVDFDYEITLLTLRASNAVLFLDPIGHYQENGDYRLSWQAEPGAGFMTEGGLKAAQEIADKVTAALTSDTETGWGIFGVELFVKRLADGTEEVIFSEVSPRPHDTGMVTLISQDQSEFALHARALLGLPCFKPSRLKAQDGGKSAASFAVLADAPGVGNWVPEIGNLDAALNSPDTELRIFGKPEVVGERRVAVTLARAKSVEKAKLKAKSAGEKLRVGFTR